MTTTEIKQAAKPDITIEPRRDAWFALREAHGLTRDTDLAAMLGVAASTTYRVLSGNNPPSADFIARALHRLPGATFIGLFKVVSR